VSGTRADEATKTYTPRIHTETSFIEQLRDASERILELERREALLTAFVARSDRLVEFEVAYPEDLWPVDVLEELSELQGSFFAGRAAIDWIPRP
jgi:hypothetical protein